MNERMAIPSTLVELLRVRAADQPNERAYSFLLEDGEEAHLTYGELDRKARALAVVLAGSGKPGDRALLLYQPSLDYIVAFFGCLYAGINAVPAYPPRQNGNLDRLQSVVNDSKATLALSTAAIAMSIERRFGDTPGLSQLQWVVTEAMSDEIAADWKEPSIDSSTLAFLQYTSGSTSAPKGVMLSHGNLLHNLELIQNSFGTTPESKGVIWLPPYHDMGLIGGILQPLFTGYPMTAMAPVDFITKPLRWLETISRTRATLSGGPNFAFDLCLQKITPEQRDQLDLSCWENAFTGAEPVRHETMERFAEYFAPSGFRKEAFYPCYGLAEGTLFVTGGLKHLPAISRMFDGEALEENRVEELEEATETSRTLVSSGNVTYGNQLVRVVNTATFTICSDEEVGEIWVCGGSVAQGYWNNEEKTEETFRAYLTDTGEGPFLRTGDLGFQRDGELFVTGRLKDLIIIRGRNHYPQDIEFTVSESHPGVHNGNGAAFALEIDGEERLIVVHELERTFRKANHEQIIRAIREAISEQHQLQVHAICLLKPASVPKTSSGKIQRHACKDRFQKGTLEIIASTISDAAVEVAAGLASAEIEVEALTRDGLLALPQEERYHKMQAYLLAEAARVLKLPVATLSAGTSLNSLGLDSLMSVELKNTIEESFNINLKLTVLMEGPTIGELAALVLSEVDGSDPALLVISGHGDDKEFPLSVNQRSLWFIQRLDPDSSAYNLSRAVKIPGKLDKGALLSAFETLVERHPLLRTTYPEVNGQPVQRVYESMDVHFALEDARDWSEEKLRDQLAADAHRPFDLEHGPLLRVHLFTRSGQETILLLSMHHIISDFWSFGVMVDELWKLYEARVKGQPMPGAATQASYADFVYWQDGMLTQPKGQDSWTYWEEQLRAATTVLTLPTDRPRPPLQTYNGSAINFRLSPELSQQVKDLAKAHNATLYMVLLAAFQVMLHRYTGQEDILVGSPMAGRASAKFADVLGYFVNPVVLRGSLHDNPTFPSYLEQVRQTVMGALDHQDFPFGTLVERLQPQRDPSYSPLFQVMFTLQKSHLDDGGGLTALALGDEGTRMGMGGLVFETCKLEQRFSQMDLALAMGDVNGALSGFFEYNVDLFDATTIQRMAGHFAVLLQAIIDDAALTIAELPMLTEPEKQQVLVDFNDTAVDYPQNICIHELFEQQAEQNPDAVALVFEGIEMSYRELNERANQLAHYLNKQGVGPDKMVGVCMERSREMVISLYGILKAGGAYVPIDPTLPEDRLVYMVEDSGIPVLLTQSHLADALPAHGAQTIFLDTEWDKLAGESTQNPAREVTMDNLAYMIYTSGTTGKPKGTMNHHLGIFNRIYWMQETFQLTGADRVLQKTPYSFDVSVWEFFWPLMFGAALVIARPEGHKDPSYLAELIKQQGVTTLHFVPSMLQVFLQEKGIEACTSIRQVMASGEALPYDLQERFFARLSWATLNNLYGPTEAAVDVTFWQCTTGYNRRIVPIGASIANTQIYVLNSRLQPAPVGVPGELHIGGIQLARGYHNRPDLSAEKFISSPFGRLYKTGDLARFLPDGNIEYLGRVDFQVKIRGFRIELGEIEVVIEQHESVMQSVVTAYDDGSGQKRLVAYVVPSGAAAISVDALRDHLRDQLPEYMVPAVFVVMEQLPLSPNGKVDRRALPKPDLTGLKTEYTAPRNAVEQALVDIYAEVLRVDRVGIDDNYFELGGDSIRSIQVVSKLKEIGLSATLQQMLQFQTIRELADLVKPADAAEQMPQTAPFALISDEDRDLLPATAVDAHPLAKLQEGMLFHSQLSPDSSVYHNVLSVHMRAPFDEAALKQTVDRLIERHPALRSSFDLVTFSESLQIIHATVSYTPLEVFDLRDMNNAEQEQYLDEWFEKEIRHYFDWTKAPLVRFQVHRRTDDTFQFAFTEHHVITDGWSVASLMTEFFQTYIALCKGIEPPTGNAPSVLYSDYVALERQALASEETKRYWDDLLSGYTFTKVPRWSHAAESGKAPEFQTRDVVVPMKVTKGLNEIALLAKAPLKNVLLAAHLKVLAALSGQSDVVTGVVSNGRPEVADGERVIGLHLNSIPYRYELNGGTWVELVKDVFAKDTDSLPHRRYPLATIQKSHGGQALFEVLFNYINFHVYDALDDVSEMAVLDHRDFVYTDFPFNVEFSLTDAGEVNLRLQWIAQEFSDEQIDAIGGYFSRTFEEMADNPQGQYEAHNLLSEAERHQSLVAFNDTRVDYEDKDLCLHQFLERQVLRTPDHVAVIFEGQSLTYRDLNERANQLARFLKKQGVGPEVTVGISIERSLEMVIGLYAIVKAGGAYVPIDPTYPQDRITHMLEDSAVRVLLTQKHLIDQLPKHGAKTIALDADWPTIAQESTENLPLQVTPTNLAYMIYTSGSTGKPKGAMNEHRGINNRLLWMQETFQLTEADRVLQKTPFSFDVSVWEFFWPLMVGATLVVARPDGHKDASYLVQLIKEQGITTLHFVPSMLQVFLEASDVHTCTSIRQVMASGEALPYELQERFFARFDGASLNNLYGPTEAAVDVTFWQCERDSQFKIVPIGRTISNTQMYVLDKNLQPVPIGSPGELHIGGIQVGRGYHNRADLTAEKFIPDPFANEPGARLYKTGDLARFLPDGNIEYLGRIDFQVKVRGLRIELGEIENALLQHPNVESGAVLVRQAADGGNTLFAFYTADRDDLDADELKAFLGESLPEFMIPPVLAKIEEIPLSPNGKIDRNRLMLLAKDFKVESKHDYVAPIDELQEKIAAVWAKVLKVERVGINDNFFDLGGHSLLVMKVFNELKAEMNIELQLTDLFQYTTVKALADAISNKGQAATAEPKRRRVAVTDRSDKDIAIIGIGLRFPEANNPYEFWRNLRNGVESIRDIAEEELEPHVFNTDPNNRKKLVARGSFIEDIDKFDAEFFGISEREARLMDPQQRLFLETAWSAIQNAGYNVHEIDAPVSLYAGAGVMQYSNPDAMGPHMGDMYQAYLAANPRFMATRTAYKLNLKGEAMTIDTACSTSLVAVHMAVQSLITGKTDYALAGGATIGIPQKTGYIYEPNFILSPDGHCRAFDKDGAGTIGGNGVGVVFLKRLADAERDGDPIYAVIKGSAINNDGSLKIGYTAPSVQGQQEVISMALDEAGVSADTITYIEAHGTGTNLGDPIEVAALTQAFREDTDRKQYCAIGSVKTNIGHLDTAAGVAGLIKTALALKYGEIPPSLHYKEANPQIDFDNSPFFVNASLRTWETDGMPRRAGVSSFGIGGTNAHVILEEAPLRK